MPILTCYFLSFPALRQGVLAAGGAPTGGQQPATKPVIEAMLAELANATAAGKPYHGVAINGDIRCGGGPPAIGAAMSR